MMQHERDTELLSLRVAVDQAANAVIITDPKGTIEFVNPAFERATGYTAAEVLGKNPNILQSGMQPREFYRDLWATLKAGKVWEGLFHNRRKNGTLFWERATISPVFNSEGEVIRFVGVKDNITARVEAEAELSKALTELRKSERFRKEAGEMARIGGWELNLATMEIEWSEETRLIHEVPTDFRPGLEEAINFFKPEARETLREAVRECILHGTAFDLELPFETASGRFIWVHIVGQLHCETGVGVRVFGTFQDISERKVAADTLRDKTEFLSTLLNAIPSPTYYKDLQGRYLGVNKAFEEVFGHAQSELIGKTVFDILPVDIADIVNKKDLALFSNPGHQAYECRIFTASGKVCEVLMQKATFTDSAGRVAGLIGTNLDITDRKRMEVALKKERQMLTETNQKLQEVSMRAEAASRAKGEFLANMSHEIRTPLNAIIGMSELLECDPSGPNAVDYIETIRSSGDALLAVISDVLDFSKIEANQLTLERLPVLLRPCVESVVHMISMAATKKGISLRSLIPDDIPVAIIGDVTRLRQILVNLLSNAVKFTHSGEVAVTLSFKQSNDGIYWLSFSVKDSGIGIPASQIGSIFNSFSQVDASITRRYGGTGLGLAISQRLVGLMAGRMYVESEVGKGSDFQFEIPVEIAESDSQLAKAEVHPEPDASLSVRCPLRILVAEDNPVNQRLVALMLRRLGYTSSLVSNGLEVLEFLKTHPCDLIFLDVQMPEMDGIDVAKKICQIYACEVRPRMVALTANSLEGDRESCLAAGMDAYLSKPVRNLQLASVLEDIYALVAKAQRSAE